MKKTAQIIGKTVKVIFIVFCVYLVSLFFREQRLPRRCVDAICDKLSSGAFVFRCESASFGFRHGLRLGSIRVLGRDKPSVSEPVLSAQTVSVDYILRRVVVTDLRFPRLPESYYEYTGVYRERNERLEFSFPEIPAFSLTLIRPQILGVEPQRLRAEVRLTKRRLDVSDIVLDWPDVERRMRLDGFTYIDLREQRVYGEVTGEARQAHIRPLLVALDVPVSLPYFDGFTGVTEPVPSFCSWDVNLMNNDFRLKLKLSPTLGRYNGVPLRRVEGEVGLHVFTRGTNLNFQTTVGPISAWDTKGRELNGTVVIRGTNNLVNVEFDARSGLPVKDTLDIIDYLNGGVLDCLTCEDAPMVSVKGTLATDIARQAENDLRGSVAFKNGTFFGIPVNDVNFYYSYVGDTVRFDEVRAVGKDGGQISGKAEIRVPGLDETRDSFSLDIDYQGGTLAELADILSVDFGEKYGKVDGRVALNGPLDEGLYRNLNGRGTIRISDGKLAQMKLFMGLTEMLADKVPGVSLLVNQSSASADFTITNGVFATDNLYVEGGLVSVKAWGSYDIPADNLDFTVRVQFLKNDSVLGKLVHPVTLPFTKLLLEFKVNGSTNDPKWDYISVLDRVL